MSRPIIGERKTNYIGYTQSSQIFGTLITDSSSSINIKKGSILSNHKILPKTLHPSDKIILTEVDFGELYTYKNMTVSTYGIDYNPTIIDNEDKKAIRRWPRDWHGENMRN